jgi:lysophospholipase L1-like esterase
VMIIKKSLTMILVIGLTLFVLTSGYSSAPSNFKAAPSSTTEIAEKRKVDTDFFKEDMKIVAIGDSLTEGLGGNEGEGGYVSFIQKQLSESPLVDQLTIVNLGIVGLRADELISRLETNQFQTAISDANVIFLTIGGNDLVKTVKENIFTLSIDVFNHEKQRYERNLTNIIDLIHESNRDADIYLLGLFNPFRETLGEVKEIEEIIVNWNDTIRQTSKQYSNVAFVPIADLFQTATEELLYTDQFHPNQTGYDLIGERLFSAMNNEDFQEKEDSIFQVRR